MGQGLVQINSERHDLMHQCLLASKSWAMYLHVQSLHTFT